jgi:uncharacterized membrane protein YozB (DUF420 family)
MLNVKDAKNIQTTSYVIALCVVANFVVIALILGPGNTQWDSTWSTVTSLLGLVINWLSLFLLGGMYVVFNIRKKGELSVVYRAVFVATVVSVMFSVVPLFASNSVFESNLSIDIVAEISNFTTNMLFLLYAVFYLRLVALDKEGMIKGWLKSVSLGFGYSVLLFQVGAMFGIIPEALVAPFFILGGVILYPAAVVGMGQLIGSSVSE